MKEDISKAKKSNKVTMSPPWSDSMAAIVCEQRAELDNAKAASRFVQQRSEVHALYITEKEKTKRIFLIIAALLFISSLLVLVFAPDGRETISYWVGATLLLFSAGAAGFTSLKAKGPLLNVSADTENN